MGTTKRRRSGARYDPSRDRQRQVIVSWVVLPIVLLLTIFLIWQALSM